jgi:hypothetical protein
MTGIKLRSKIRWAEEGEKPTKYFCNLEKRNYLSKLIYELETGKGTIQDQTEIMNEQKNFFSDLYRSRRTNLRSHHFWSINSCPLLNNEQKMTLEGGITLKEAALALKNFKNGKSPGSDGFTAEFCK